MRLAASGCTRSKKLSPHPRSAIRAYHMAYLQEEDSSGGGGAEAEEGAAGSTAEASGAAAGGARARRITFLYRLQEGAADASFGLNVAQVGPPPCATSASLVAQCVASATCARWLPQRPQACPDAVHPTHACCQRNVPPCADGGPAPQRGAARRCARRGPQAHDAGCSAAAPAPAAAAGGWPSADAGGGAGGGASRRRGWWGVGGVPPQRGVCHQVRARWPRGQQWAAHEPSLPAALLLLPLLLLPLLLG